MRLLLACWVLLILYLSLYPFDFIPVASGTVLVSSLPHTDGDWVDTIANLMFYLPLGFLGLAAWKGRIGVGLTVVCILGALLSLSMELAQVYLPTRYSSLLDTACNSAGTLAGCLAYWGFRVARLSITIRKPSPSASVLIVCWSVWQLFPLIPMFRRTKLAEIYAQLSSIGFQGVAFIDILLAAVVLYAFLAQPCTTDDRFLSSADLRHVRFRLAGPVFQSRPLKHANVETGFLVSVILFLVLLMQSVVVGLTFSNLRLFAAASGLIVALCFWRAGVRTSWIVLASVLLVWTGVREIAAPMHLSWVPFDIGGVSPHLAPYVRAVAGRTFFCWATLVAVVRAVSSMANQGSILSSPIYVYSKEQGGNP